LTGSVARPVAHQARFADLTPAQLYGILRLRTDVFGVEQRCPYPELDGRDTEPTTRHLWFAAGAGASPGPGADGGAVVATLRLLRDDEATCRIGRVATAKPYPGAGLATELITAALRHCEGLAAVLDAQAHLVDFYARFGFRALGAEFVEDGIAHRRMRRPADRAPR